MRSGRSVAALAAALVVTGCAGDSGEAEPAEAAATTTEAPVRVLVDAAQACGLANAGVLGDDGASLNINTGGAERSSDQDVEDLGCVLFELETPDHVITHLDTTRALDGMQEDEWGEISARWTYHPDNGLDVTLVDRSL